MRVGYLVYAIPVVVDTFEVYSNVKLFVCLIFLSFLTVLLLKTEGSDEVHCLIGVKSLVYSLC